MASQSDDFNQATIDLIADHFIQSGGGRSIQEFLQDEGLPMDENVHLTGPGTYFLVGRTMSGKTTCIRNIIHHTRYYTFYRKRS